MATKKTSAKPKPQAPEFASKAELEEIKGSVDSLAESVGSLVDLIKAQSTRTAPAAAAPVAVAETPMDKEVKKASADTGGPVNPEWEEKAREILGEALDRCEVQYLRKGGTVFTVIIKNEHSNAPQEYLLMNKIDRRSKEIGNEGIEGVEQWCKLVKSNLARPNNR